MKKRFLTLMAFAATSLIALAQDYTQYVDPFIGTGGHGHVFLGANVPFGNIQAGPTQKKQGWDWLQQTPLKLRTFFSYTELF